jgi:hypothetical protein
MTTFESKLTTLYDFVSQGETQATTDDGKAAFAVTKTRFEILFPNLFPKRDLKAENAELEKDAIQLRAELKGFMETV